MSWLQPFVKAEINTMTSWMEIISREWADRAPAIITALVLLVSFLVLARVAQSILDRISRRFDPSRRDVVVLAGQAAKFTLVVLGILTSLGTLGINITALVASLGLTGFALGFALRDALSSLLAGVLILFYEPFRRGDRIGVAGFEGEVLEIDLRYTRIQAADRVVLVPNSSLFTNTISLLPKKPPEPEKPPPDGS